MKTPRPPAPENPSAVPSDPAAARLRPDFVPALNNLANALQATGETAEAKALFLQALQLAPDRAELHCNLASLREAEGDMDCAMAGYRRAVAVNPGFFLAHYRLAKALAAQGEPAEALAACQTALRLKPDSAEAQLDCGTLHHRLGRLREALACYRAAVRIQPDSAPAHNSLGAAWQELGEFARAETCYRRALELQPDFDLPLFNLGQILEHLGKLPEARQHYERALALRPDNAKALYHFNYVCQQLVDWDDYLARMARLTAATETHLKEKDAEGLPARMAVVFPLPMALHKAVAEQLARHHAKGAKPLAAPTPPEDPSPPRLRIGYVSPDFRCHAVGTLIRDVFRHHARPELEVFAYSLVPVVDDWTEAIRRGCDHYRDVSRLSPEVIARQIRADGIHILVDLAGYTTHSRTALFAYRPAPVQIQYLGYTGTMGADYLPYIVADDLIIPESHAEHYTETVIRLPQAWPASPMSIADTPMSRTEHGLPEGIIVFCCFNAFYKIEPSVFACWMRILRQVPDSVLWLRDGGEDIAARFRRHAAAEGIAPERLVFAPDLPHAEYLARYRLADVFLDTFLYNAGATAAGALWAGLPVLTCPGEGYASRMGASLCRGVGMPELICDSVAEYERRAIEWGNQPARLADIRAKLAQSVQTAPLFRPDRLVRSLEDAFRRLWRQHIQQQSQPTHSLTLSTGSDAMASQPSLTIHGSEGLPAWLQEQRISLAFSTYQGNRLFLVGRKPDGRLAATERLFDRPMGLYADGKVLHMVTRRQVWRLDNRLEPGTTHRGWDALFVPAQSHTTGDVNAHEVAVDRDGRVLFVNTSFSCIATLKDGYSFEPVWQPPFITQLVAEDRCHLNGLALRDGRMAYATACSATDSPAGWRDRRLEGGIVLHVPSGEIIATGLSMPHSPRWHRDRLWLLNSGTGELGHLDGGRFVPVAFCPGFVRGLAFWERWALVGFSKLRSTSFGGLPLETRLRELNQPAQCGLAVIDLDSGAVVHGLMIDGTVEELFDVAVLPGFSRPGALGFRDEEIERLVTFPGSGGLVAIKPGVGKAGVREDGAEPNPQEMTGPVKYQRVFHLTPENLLPYEALMYPGLKERWARQPLRGELVGVSASVEGDLVGFAVAEQWQDAARGQVEAELISWFVRPALRSRGIGKALLLHIRRALGEGVAFICPEAVPSTGADS